MQDIFISEKGRGFPLVLIHGFLGASKIWKPQIDFFKDYYYVLSVDLPGYGKSNQISTQITIESLANLVLDKLKETKDINGKSLFENSVVSYGTNIRSGHGIEGLPIILSGGGIKNLRLGESIMLPTDTALQNLWLTLLQEVGVSIDKFSTSTGSVSQILS